MRVSIRAQLGLLVLLCSLMALAVIAVATWVTNYNFVVSIRLSGLSLTASLYGQQILSSLSSLDSAVQAISTRVLVQNALQRYNQGNDTVENWTRAISDLGIALTGAGTSQYLLQCQVVSKNGSGVAGRAPLIQVTGAGLPAPIQLPGKSANGSNVFLGDPGPGYPSNLYPNLTFTSTPVNSTFNLSTAYYNGKQLYSNTSLTLGPWLINSTFGLMSITVPIINNTSIIDTLGWLTVVVSTELLFDVQSSLEGLSDTGQILLLGPNTIDNKFPPGILYSSAQTVNKAQADNDLVRFVLPPLVNQSRSTRHSNYQFGASNDSFPLRDYVAIENAVTKNNRAINNAGSVINTRNENNDQVAVGYALATSPLVDWVLLVEQAHGEVVQPINHLRNVLLACVFGTAGAITLIIIPLAHYSVRPIRRLRKATKKTVDYTYFSDSGSIRSYTSNQPEWHADEDDEDAQIARKEGFLGAISSRWRKPKRRHRRHRSESAGRHSARGFRIPSKVPDRKHFIEDELTDLTTTFNEMCEELMMQYERLEERVRERTAELELSKKAAEAANESKTLFIANISHELKTPLNGILGMCAVCMHEDDQTKIKRSLGIIYKSGDLLLHLLTDLLTFSKNQIGQQLTLEEKEFRLSDVSSQILHIFEKQAKEGSIHLRLVYEGPNESLDTASGTPGQAGFGPYGTGRVRDMCLWGDQHRILQVIINLVNNSLKFTPPGGSVVVRIKCVGESDVDRPPSSRKGSTQSKQSRGSKQSKKPSSRVVWSRGRHISSSQNSVAAASPAVSPGIDSIKDQDTALQINAREPKVIPHVNIRERSASPPPINARTLLFEFEVEDTGPGIPTAQQRKVFEPFVQGDLGLSKKYGGTGLGLSICSQLASLMRGTIMLKSEEGVGSTFTMRIPLKFTKERAESTASSNVNSVSRRNSYNVGSIRDEPGTPIRNSSTSELSIHSDHEAGSTAPVIKTGFESPASKPRLVGLSQPFFATSPPLETPQAQLEAMEKVAAEATKAGGKVRVLVAEDNKVNQEVVLRMLKLEDIYDVTVAKDGQEAYDLVKLSMEQHNLFNLIFMDIQMPNVDGLQSTRLIREMGYSAPIVALTAFAEESNVKECLDSGMDFFLPKPIRRPALKQVLKRYCATIPEGEEGELAPASPAGKTSSSAAAAAAADARERKERKNTTAGKGGPLTSTYANGSVSGPSSSSGKEAVCCSSSSSTREKKEVNGTEKKDLFPAPLLERRDATTVAPLAVAAGGETASEQASNPKVNGLVKLSSPVDEDNVSPFS